MTRNWLPGTLVALLACSGSPTRNDHDVTEAIAVTQVEVEVSAATPTTATAHVWGAIGGGCATLLPATRSRSGNELTLTLLARTFVPDGHACTADMRGLCGDPFPLGGDFPPGTYTLRVNDFVHTFVVAAPRP